MQKGTISVQTENIFPIIKQYLYSDQEIFLRELVSNAVDATQKLQTLSLKGEIAGELGNLTIEVKVDQDKGTLTISDKGIGMTQEEVEKYITQIAFSSAQEFIEKYKDDVKVIGHFGLGFFSAFMVSDKVEIITQSWKADAPTVHWTCEGNTEYTMDTLAEPRERGTDIILHIAEDAKDYLADSKVEELLTKYCRFLPATIQFGTKEEFIPKEKPATDEITPEDAATETTETEEETESITVPNIISNPTPAWTKKPSELTDEDYLAFYKELYPYGADPLFWIHLNVDYPFNLTGILYFPKVVNNYELKKDRIHLYCSQVFVTDHVEEIVPDFLMLLHGVIDSPDIPLNVSRSYLQSDPEVKKISKYITRKVADKLDELFRKDRKGFEEKWEYTNVFVKYGMLSEDKFYDKAKKFCLLETTDKKYYTVDGFKEAVKAEQTDKNDTTVFLYTTDVTDQHSYVEAATSKGYQVLNLNTMIDPHFMQHIESKWEKVSFKRVDADTLEQLIEKDNKFDSILNEEQETELKDLFTTAINSPSVSVSLSPLTPNDRPVMITKPEFMRRMKDMSRLSGESPFGGMDMPEYYNVVVNTNHPTVSSVLGKEDELHRAHGVKQLYDLALLQQGMLKGADLTSFINRSIDLIK